MDTNMLLALCIFVLCPIGALLISLLPEQSRFADLVDHVIEANKFEQRLAQLTMREEEILGIPGEFEGYTKEDDAAHKLWGEANLPNCEYCGQKVFIGGIYCSEKCQKANELMLKQDAEEATWPKCEICGNIHRNSGPYCSEKCAELGAAEAMAILREQFEAYYNGGHVKKSCRCGVEIPDDRCECSDCEFEGIIAAHEKAKAKYLAKGGQYQWGDAV